MTPDEINKLETALDDIEEIRNKIESLYSSSTIPRDVETAFKERLGGVITSTGTTGSATTQSVSVPSVPTNITVPAQPSGTIAIVVNGTTYNVLYK